MRILVTGSREWTDWRLLHEVLEEITKGIYACEITLVHGACLSGADALAGDLARCAGWTEECHPADWNLHGKAAGPIRNQEMTDLGADICVAFFKTGAGNKGTGHCAARAEAAGIPVRRVEG